MLSSDTDVGYRLHDLNRDFVWQDVPAERLRRISPEQARQFDERGFFVFPDAFTAEEIESVIAAIDPLEEEHERLTRASGGSLRISHADAITFTVNLVKRSAVLRDFAAHPIIKDICHDLVGDDVRLYWDQSVYKKSGKPQEFPWHQDNGYTFTEPQQYLTLWIPLVDVDDENGCPWIAPGMHKLGTLEHRKTPLGERCLDDVPDAVCVPARAGDIIVFSSLAPHRTGPNFKTGSVRKAYVLQYAPDGAIAQLPTGERVTQNEPERQFLILNGGR